MALSTEEPLNGPVRNLQLSGTPDHGPPDLITARSAIAMRLDGNGPAAAGPEVLYAKAAHTRFPPASMTKLMTALLAIERGTDLEQPIAVLESDLRKGSGNHLLTGDTLTLRDALHSLLIPSSNTAAEAIARTLGQLEGFSKPRQGFIDLMNARASSLGLADTTLTNPSGLHDDTMMSHAADMMALLREVAQHPFLVDILGTRYAWIKVRGTLQRIQRRTTARALDQAGLVAGKTGTRPTGDRQYHLAAMAEVTGATYGFVLMKSVDNDARTGDTNALLSYLSGGARATTAARPTADEVSKTVNGLWLRPPPTAWRLHRAARLGQALAENRSKTMSLVRISNPRSRLSRLERSQASSESLALITNGDISPDATRFPVLKVARVSEALATLAEVNRSKFRGKVVAVTGSVGKTSTCAILGTTLTSRYNTYFSTAGRNILASVWEHCIGLGEETRAVIEVAGEALPDAAPLVRPDVAVVTAVSEAHMADTHSLEQTARLKAQLFSGLGPTGTAVVNQDAEHADILLDAAKQHTGRVITYGSHPAADVQLQDYDPSIGRVSADFFGDPIQYNLGLPGKHNALNSLAALSAIHGLGEDVRQFTQLFQHLSPVAGRGVTRAVSLGTANVTLVDQSHNANPLSMRAALADFASRFADHRRVLVLGDMLELGPDEAALHAHLLEAVLSVEPASVYLLGPRMAHLWTRLPDELRGAHLNSTKQLRAILQTDLQSGDAVLAKASRSTGLEKLIAGLSTGSQTPKHLSWRITITGPTVHGVGFRAWFKKQALAAGVDGWVRNRGAGQVEALISGPGGDLRRIFEQLHSGPRKAEVTRVVTRRVSILARQGFRIKPNRAV